MRKRIPIQGIPTERPTCKGCSRKLRPTSTDKERQVPTKVDTPEGTFHGHRTETASRTFLAWDGYDGFHTLNCALRFAIAAFKGGYRVQGGRQ